MKFRRILAMLLCVLMCVSVMPAAAFATDDNAEEEIMAEVIPEAEEPAEEAESAEEAEEPAEEAAQAEEPAEDTAEVEEPAEEAAGAEEPAEDTAKAEETEEIPEAPETEDEDNEFDSIVDSGICGVSLTWKLDDMGALAISGSGDMDYWGSISDVPWYSHKNLIKSVVVANNCTGIGNWAFSGCTALTSVKLGDSITYIGNNAFSGCTALPSVTLPGTLSSIGSYAFNNCTRISKIVLPDSVTYIDEAAFYGCTGITSFTIGSGVFYIGPSAFYGCKNLTAVALPDGVTVIDAFTFAECSKLESVSFGTYVTAIYENAFVNCSALSAINLPAGLFSIGNAAFSGCGISSVTIPDSVYNMGSNVFKDCAKLTKATFGTGFASIPTGTFAGCTALASVVIPSAVTAIETNAFQGCSGLKYVFYGSTEADWDALAVNAYIGNIVLQDAIVHYESTGHTYVCGVCLICDAEDPSYSAKLVASGKCGTNLKWKLDSNGTLFIYGEGNMNNYTQTSVAPWAKYTVNSVIIHGAESIGDYAFYRNANVASVDFGTALLSIGKYAFYKCPALSAIVVPSYVKTIGAYAFNGCGALISVKLPANLKTIGTLAIEDCAYEVIYFEGTMAQWNAIGYLADCDVVCSDGTVYGSNIASGVTGSLSWILNTKGTLTIFGSGNMADYTNAASVPWNAYAEKIKNIIVEDGAANIGKYAFAGLANVERVSISDTVAVISEHAFDGCAALKAISISEYISAIGAYAFANSGLTSVTVPGTVYTIGNNAFQDCKALASVTLEYFIQTIGASAFSGCSALTEITVPGTALTIGANTFENCTALKKAVLGDGISSVEERMFIGCTALASVTLPDTIDYICLEAFKDCSSLTSIVLNNVYSIDDSAFYGCTSLSSVKLGKTLTDIGNSVFEGCSALASIALPDTLMNVGTAAFKDCTALKSIKIPDSMTAIPAMAFMNCTELKTVTISDSVTSIGDKAFCSCTKLASITLPDSITTVGYAAFHSCSALSEIVLPDSVTDLGSYAFYNCTKLANVTLSQNITAIAEYTFYNCSAITAITIPAGVTSIGAHAFGKCTGLKNVTFEGTDADWAALTIGIDNEPLTAAKLTCIGKVAAPVISGVYNYADYIKVIWAPVPGATTYRLFMKEGSGAWQKVCDTISTAQNIKDLKGGVNYTFMVRCVSNDGKTFVSDYSVAEGITRLVTPEVVCGNISDGFSVKWNAADGASAYKVYYRVKGSTTWINYTSSRATETNIHISPIPTPGTEFEVAVLSYASGKTSGFPATPLVIKYVGTNLSAPVITSVKNEDEYVRVTWNKVTNAEKYRVLVKEEGGKWITATDTASDHVNIGKLKSGVTYYFMVRCVSNDGSTYMSPYSNTGSVKVMSAPVITNVKKQPYSAIFVLWQYVDNATGYKVYYREKGTSTWTLASTVTNNWTEIKGMPTGKTYQITVVAVGDGVESGMQKTPAEIVY